MLRFLHLPKTGGTSLREAFVKVFGKQAIFDYDNLRHPMLQRLDPDADTKRVRNVLHALNARVILGHGAYCRHSKTIKAENTITFVREPVSQVLSWFYFCRRVEGYTGTLQEFIQLSHVRNNQTQMLQDLRMDLAFVGLFEKYEESLLRLNRRFKLDLPLAVSNVNPDKPRSEPYVVDPDTLELLKRLNSEDIEMYNRVEQAFNATPECKAESLARLRERLVLSLPESFDKVYRSQEWGVGSGEGSNPALAAPYIRLVEKFLKEKNIRTVLDCGCGDLQIASSINWGSASYHGIDASAEALTLASTRVKKGFTLEQAVISTRPWGYDLALVKEVFQHLPFSEIHTSLQLLKGCKYVLITNDVPSTARDIPFGHYRPIDIRDAPLNVKAQPLLKYRVGNTTKLVLLIDQSAP